MKQQQGVFLRALAGDATQADIDVIGVIGWEVWYPAMRDMLRSIPDAIKRVVFHIYSPGGDVWEGNAIIQEIGELNKRAETVARVQVAASMATLIAMATQTRTIAANGRWLIHNPWTATQGDADEFEKRAKELRDAEREAARFYAARTGQTEDAMLALMDEERWLTPAEAMEYGFVGEIDDPFAPEEYAEVRAAIESAGKWPQALVEMATADETGADEGAQEGGTDEDTDTDGGESGAGADAGGDDAGEPDTVLAQNEAAKSAAYEAGRRAGAQAATASWDDERTRLIERLSATEQERRKWQSQCQRTEADAEKAAAAADARLVELTAMLADANARLEKHLNGSLAYTPAVETWEQAMAACGGDYEKARKAYGDVFNATVARFGQKARKA